VFAEEKGLNTFLSASGLGLPAKKNWPSSVFFGTPSTYLEAKGNQLILAGKIKGYIVSLGMLAYSGYDLS
jgi:hypothetical protein